MITTSTPPAALAWGAEAGANAARAARAAAMTTSGDLRNASGSWSGAPDSSVRDVLRGCRQRRSGRTRAPSRDGHGPRGPFGRTPLGSAAVRGGALGSAGVERTHQGRDGVREGVSPVAHRLAGGEGRRLEDGPPGRRAGSGPLARLDLDDGDLDAGLAHDLAGPLRSRRATAVDEVVDRRA